MKTLGSGIVTFKPKRIYINLRSEGNEFNENKSVHYKAYSLNLSFLIMIKVNMFISI